MAEKQAPGGPGEALAGFIEGHRRIIVIVSVTAVAALLLLAAGMGVWEHLGKRGIVRLESLLERYDALRFSIAEPGEAEAAAGLLRDALAEARKSPGFAGARAWYLAASIQADLGDWAEAESSWGTAAKKAGKTWLAPAALFNAGAAAEERGDPGAALDHYRRSSAWAEFPQAARALFSAGRIEEGRGDPVAAVEAYRTVVEKWPSTPWANLANGRIIALAALGSQ